MGEWSPECVGTRWVGDARGPAQGAKFEGDNVAKLGPITLKKWSTTSEITEYVPEKVFQFVSSEFTTWRYEFEDLDGKTNVSESYSYTQYEGREKFFYETLGRRSAGMVKGVEHTLAKLKTDLEAR